MEDIIDDVIDSIVDGVSSIFDSGDSVIDNTIDMVDGISDNAIQSLVNGDFKNTGCDFSDLFDVEDVDSNVDSSQISFGSHIDDVYDPLIKNAQEDIDYHTQKVIDSQTVEDMEYHQDKVHEADCSEDYYKQCKIEAEGDLKKREAFNDEINTLCDIADRLQGKK